MSSQLENTATILSRKLPGIIKYSKHSSQKSLIRAILAIDATHEVIWPNEQALKSV